MKKVFVDCGGHQGQSVRGFLYSLGFKHIEDPTEFTIYSFEPNPAVSEKYRDREDIVFSDAAVWIYDGEIDFYVDSHIWAGIPSLGSTLIREKDSGDLNFDNPLKVKCIDLSKWIMDNFDKDDFIIVKMDIEGGEYKILNKMIEDDSISYINELRMDWHSHKIGMPISEHNELVAKLESIKTLSLLKDKKL